MEALSVDEIPEGKNWQYEPKWDGFRGLIFRDGAAIELQSKSGQSLTRYFPELVVSVASLKPKRFVLDGEIVVPSGRAFSFDDLLQRIHPAASRVKRLTGETPALLIVFDLLIGDDGQSLVKTPLASRRKLLEAFARKYLPGQNHPAVAGDNKDCSCQKMAQASGRKFRRHHRQTQGPALRVRQSPWHAKNKELPVCRLRGGRLSLQRRKAHGRLAAARFVRWARPAEPCRLHLRAQERREESAHRKA